MNTETHTNTPATLRDQFAMAALSGLLASEGEALTPSHGAADRAYAIADEMMIARDRPRQEKHFYVASCDFVCMETGSDQVSRWKVKVNDGGRGFELEVKADVTKSELFYDAPYAFLYDEEDGLFDLLVDEINAALDRAEGEWPWTVK